METNKSINPAYVVGAIALVVLVIAVLAFRVFRSGASGSGGYASAPEGKDIRTKAPVVQRYPDGSIVPYNAAPDGAIPGNPASVKR